MAAFGDEAAYTKAGIPALNEAWTGQEYVQAIQVIESGKIPLPMLANATGLKLFQRLTSDENLAHLSDKSNLHRTRYQSSMTMAKSLAKLYSYYHSQTVSKGLAKPEMAMIVAMVEKVKLCGCIIALEIELPKKGDVNYDSRMEGVKIMNEHRLKSYQSMIELVGDLPLSNEIADEFVLKGLENHTDQLLPLLTQESRDSSKSMLKEFIRDVKPAQQERIKKVIDKLSKKE